MVALRLIGCLAKISAPAERIGMRPPASRMQTLVPFQGLDGDAMGGGGTFKSIAGELSNCRPAGHATVGIKQSNGTCAAMLAVQVFS